MNHSIAFDTLAYSRTLQDAGVPRKQAEAMAAAQKAAFEGMVSTRELATKADIARVEKLIAESKNDTIHAMYNTMIGLAAVMSAVVIGSVCITVAFLK